MLWILEWFMRGDKKTRKKDKKVRFMKVIVTFVIVANCLFAMGVLYVFYKIGLEPTVLIGSWFAFTTTELLSLARIKNKESDNDQFYYGEDYEKGDFINEEYRED